MYIRTSQVYVGVPVNFTVYLQNTCSLPCKFKFERPGGPHPDYEISFDPQKGTLGPKEVRIIYQIVFSVCYVQCQFCFYFLFSQLNYCYAPLVEFRCLLWKQSSCLTSPFHLFNHLHLLLHSLSTNLLTYAHISFVSIKTQHSTHTLTHRQGKQQWSSKVV